MESKSLAAQKFDGLLFRMVICELHSSIGNSKKVTDSIESSADLLRFGVLVIPAGADELSYIRALDSKWDIFSLV